MMIWEDVRVLWLPTFDRLQITWPKPCSQKQEKSIKLDFTQKSKIDVVNYNIIDRLG